MVRVKTNTKFGDGVLKGFERFKDKGMTSYVEEDREKWPNLKEWLAGDLGYYPARMVVILDNPIPDFFSTAETDNSLCFYRSDVVSIEEDL